MKNSKDVSEITCTCVDFGSFISLAEKLSETYANVNYFCPIEREFRRFEDACIGRGIPGLNKIPSFMDINVIKNTDLWLFPDIGFDSEQKYLKSLGKPVFGSMGADIYERLRTLFIETVEEVGLPMVPSKTIKGVPALRDYLKTVKNKWVKINEFRDNVETWHHEDYAHSVPMLASLSVMFGDANWVVFVVQDALDGATEIGYDGWCIDGWFPNSSFNGYESKNEAYLGAQCDYDDLPEELRTVNEKFSKVLGEYGYRNFIATEIRNLDGIPYFIDPTLRMPGQTGEQLLETMDNMPEVIWKGAQGEFVQPKWNAKFAGSATLNYKGDCDGEKVITVSKKSKQWVKLCRYGRWGGDYHFPANPRTDTGVVIGMADTIEDTISAIKDNFNEIGDKSVSIKEESFVELLKEIKKAQDEGIKFTDQKIPSPNILLNG
jgi:hypothetical protein